MGGTSSARAIVAYEPDMVDKKANWKLESVVLRDLGPDELLVRMVASGICHTDVIFAQWPKDMIPYPKVLGHEGSGYVQAVGANVKVACSGDPVLMSFQSCSVCKQCKEEHPAYCENFSAPNYGGEQDIFQLSRGSAAGSFFGQSSFASHSIVRESSVINVANLVKGEEELKLFSPLGCGFQSGVGTITQLAGVSKNKKESVVVMGLGGVGLSAIMAAKMKDCSMIIGIDRVQSRLELALSFGATHVINTSESKNGLVKEIKDLTKGTGVSITIDTTGDLDMIGNGMEITANRGQMILLGVPPLDASLSIHLVPFLQSGKILRGSIEGDAIPAEFIPQMITWYREGKLPIDRLIKYYKPEDFATAIQDMHRGLTVKPVLVW